MTAAGSGTLSDMFRHFARREFHGHSIRYECLAGQLAEEPALAAPLLAAPPGQRRAILYLAAVQYLLRTRAPGHPLASYLPTLGGTRDIDDGLLPALADLVTAFGEELTTLCATRITQTNEARRATLIRPGLGRATELAAGRPLHLVELGTSAGLLLLTDRYACRYTATNGSAGAAGRTATYGPDGTSVGSDPLLLECAVRSTGWPAPAAVPLSVADRTGIDLAPVDATDPAATDWLRSCVWPEQTERLHRLDTALAEVARIRPRLVTGDMVGALPEVLAGVPDNALPCVFTSNAVTYLDPAARRALVDVLHEAGSRRDLAVVLNEASEAGAELFLGHRPEPAGPPGVLAVGLLTVVTWRDGLVGVEPLARTAPHGQSLEWVAPDGGVRASGNGPCPLTGCRPEAAP